MARPLRADLTGRVFGKLTVVVKAPIDRERRQAMWVCRCECGTLCIRSGGGLNRGTVNSCGCLIAETNRRLRFKHGHDRKGERTRAYRIWVAMRQRCALKSAINYDRYGGKGISVCDEWAASFEAFLRDMGEPPSDKHTIDRLDNEKGYEPGNCRWATYQEQNLNRRKWRRRRKAA